jgi:hypothetical protein
VARRESVPNAEEAEGAREDVVLSTEVCARVRGEDFLGPVLDGATSDRRGLLEVAPFDPLVEERKTAVRAQRTTRRLQGVRQEISLDASIEVDVPLGEEAQLIRLEILQEVRRLRKAALQLE